RRVARIVAIVRAPDGKAPSHPHHEWGEQRPQVREYQLRGDELSQRNLLPQQAPIEVTLERVQNGHDRCGREDDQREAGAALAAYRGLTRSRETKNRVFACLRQAVYQRWIGRRVSNCNTRTQLASIA